MMGKEKNGPPAKAFGTQEADPSTPSVHEKAKHSRFYKGATAGVWGRDGVLGVTKAT